VIICYSLGKIARDYGRVTYRRDDLQAGILWLLPPTKWGCNLVERAKQPAMNTYTFLNAKARRICTSKLPDSKSFRINTYTKCGEGEDSLATADSVRVVASLGKWEGATQ
jgi:hypothetical protein